MMMTTQSEAAPVFPFASVSEILLCSIKDEFYIDEIQKSISEITEGVAGPQTRLRLTPEIKLVSTLAYLGLTTGTGLQTLGEEYVSIFQVDKHELRKASLFRRWILVALRVIVPYLLARSKERWENILGSHQARRRQRHLLQQRQGLGPPPPQSEPQGISRVDRSRMARTLGAIDRVVSRMKRFADPFQPFFSSLESVQVALFYIYGRYSHVFHRLAGLVLLRTQQCQQPPVSFTLIGCLILLRHGVQGLTHMVRYLKRTLLLMLRRRQVDTRKKEKESDPSTTRIPSASTASDLSISASTRHVCTVCLGVPVSPTLTLCGHVFCWCCIVNTVPRQTKCPLCREKFKPQELRCIYNY